MSRNGESLSDWQDIVNGINERILACIGTGRGRFLSVPVSDSHIRSLDAKNMIQILKISNVGFGPICQYLDKDMPIVSIEPGDSLWSYNPNVTGKAIYDFRQMRSTLLSTNYPGPRLLKSIYEDIPEFGSIPSVGSRLSSCGWFLDQMDEVLSILVKVGTYFSSVRLTSYRSYYTWNVTTGEVTDNLNWGTLIDGVTISSYQDFYNFVLAHFQEVSSVDRSAKIEIQHFQVIGGSDEFVSIELMYQEGHVYPPGGLPGDLTAYVSTTGDNLGWPVTNYTYVENDTLMQHIDYTSKNFQNVTPGVPANIGFDSSTFATAPALPALGQNYVKAEDINHVWCVWDFAPYFQY